MQISLLVALCLSLTVGNTALAAGTSIEDDPIVASVQPITRNDEDRCITVDHFAADILPGATHTATIDVETPEARQLAGTRLLGRTSEGWTLEVFKVAPHPMSPGRTGTAGMFKDGCLDIPLQPWWLR